MNQKTQNILRKVGISFFAIALVSQICLLADFASAGVYPIFNSCPEDKTTLRVKNRTQGDASWNTYTDADPGDRIAFNVYYHNTVEGSIADNTKIRLDFVSNQGSQMDFKAYLWADNADAVSGSAVVGTDCSEGLEINFDGKAIWYPNQSSVGQQISVTKLQSNSILVDIGDIAGGWAHQGYVVFEGVLSSPQPEFNSDSQDKKTLRLKNRTKGDTEWKSSISAEPGDRIAFAVYYHNAAVCSIADNTTIEITFPTSKQSTITPTTYIRANNAVTVSDSATIYVNSPETLDFITPVLWYPNRSDVAQNVSMTETSGKVKVNIGDIKGCWEYQGDVVFEALLSETSKNPDLTVTKLARNITAGSGWSNIVNAEPGDNIEFKIEISSTGDAIAEDVIVQDIMPPKMSYLGDLRIDGAYSSYDITGAVGIGDIAVGQKKIVTFDARVYSEGNFVYGTTDLVNRAKVRADDVSQKEDTAIVQVTRDHIDTNVGLSINKTVKNLTRGDSNWHESVNAEPGDQIRFKIDISASGNTSATQVVARDILPFQMSYNWNLKVDGVAKSANITASNLNLGDMSPGQTRTITLDANINSASSFGYGTTNLVNTARVSASNVSQKEDSATIQVTRTEPYNPPSNPDFTVEKLVQNVSRGDQYWHESIQASPSDKIAFYVKITSTGDSAANNIVVKDTLPSTITYEGDLRVGGVYHSGGITQGISIGSLAPGETKIITFDAKVRSETYFSYGQTKHINTILAYNTDVARTNTALVYVTRTGVAGGVTEVPTGFSDTLINYGILPLAIALAAVFLFRNHFFKAGEKFSFRKAERQDYLYKKALNKVRAKAKSIA